MTLSNAFYLIDKPSGMTSFGVLREMRRILWIKKIGHTGTLDPLATGLLLVATGEYTKLISHLETASKTYEATICLDGVSQSYDSDTEISFLPTEKQDHFAETLSREKISILLDTYFLGKIMQTPPAYSALKIQWKTALERILAWENVIMTPRETEIYSYEIQEFSYPKLIVNFHVQSGTYIRSLAHDLGQQIGSGWYISELRRTGISHINIADAHSLDALTPDDTADISTIFPESIYTLRDDNIFQRLGHGQRVRVDVELPEGREILLSDGDDIRYIAEYRDGVVHPRKKISTT